MFEKAQIHDYFQKNKKFKEYLNCSTKLKFFLHTLRKTFYFNENLSTFYFYSRMKKKISFIIYILYFCILFMYSFSRNFLVSFIRCICKLMFCFSFYFFSHCFVYISSTPNFFIQNVFLVKVLQLFIPFVPCLPIYLTLKNKKTKGR